MANVKAVSDEEIIAALLQHGTVKAAAAAVGAAPRTIYDRMTTREFRALYAAAKNDIVRAAVFTINRKLTDAIATVAEVMENPANQPAIRLQAARLILDNAARFSERLATDEREARCEAQSPWDFDM